MKLIIDIPEQVYEICKQMTYKGTARCAEWHIANGIPYDKVIDKVTELLENEWGYEGMRDDVSRIMKGEEGG